MDKLAAILCADWSMHPRRRAVFAADVTKRLVYRPKNEVEWSLGSVLKEAERLASRGSVLVGFDAPLGLPLSYLQVATPRQSFLEWLALSYRRPAIFEACRKPEHWSIERPFFSVAPGAGGLKSFQDAAARLGVDLYRRIDLRTKAKSAFIKSGIPGSVGSAACSLWAEMGPLLQAGRNFSVWPFDGEIESLIGMQTVIIGEIYPRAAYATALSDEPVAQRAPISISKTDSGTRSLTLAALRDASWVRKLDLQFENFGDALASEDQFDACMSAAALLRCVIEGDPLCCEPIAGFEREGGILGTGSVNLAMTERSPRMASRKMLRKKPFEKRVS